MDQQSPINHWYPGPIKIGQSHPTIKDTSGIPLKAELVVPPPDRISQSDMGTMECLAVLKLPMPDPEHWSPDGSYVSVGAEFSPAASRQSSPNYQSICDGNSEKNYGEIPEDDYSDASEEIVREGSEQNPTELLNLPEDLFEEYSETMCPARKLNVDGEGDFLYFLIGRPYIGNRHAIIGKLALYFRVYIHVSYTLDPVHIKIGEPPQKLWVSGSRPTELTAYHSPGVLIPSVEVEVRPEAGVQRQNILTKQQRDLVEKLKEMEFLPTPLKRGRILYGEGWSRFSNEGNLHSLPSSDSELIEEELRGRPRWR